MCKLKGIDQEREAQLVGAVQFTDCTSPKEQDSSNECPGYEIKQSDGVAQS